MCGGHGPFGTLQDLYKGPEKSGDMGFRQYLYRGMKNALAESVLVAIAYNFNKLHWKIQSQKHGIRLYELNKTA